MIIQHFGSPIATTLATQKQEQSMAKVGRLSSFLGGQ
jgi:hypothetical protein